MKLCKFLKKYLLLLACALLVQLPLVAQVPTQQHTVEQGETLYRISKKYGVTVDMLLQHNPGLTAESLSIGKTILIPVAGMQTLPVVATHKVKKGETMWSISQKYGITVEELIAANPEMAKPNYKLKKGREVNIPKAQPKAKVDSVAEKKDKPKEKIQGQATVKVAVVMPFKTGEAESERCLEYYRGFLMAADEVRANGKIIEIYTYNEPAATQSVDSVLNLVKQRHVDLLVGPVYTTHTSAFANFAVAQNVKNLVPFSSKVKQVASNAQIYLVNAPDTNKHSLAVNLFTKVFKNKETVVFLSTKKRNEAAFTDYMAQRLAKEGYTTKTLPATFSNADLKSALTVGTPAVVVPDASDLASYKDLMQRMKGFKEEFPGYQTSIFGYPEWQTYTADTLYNIYKANTYLFTNFYYNTYSKESSQFEKNYKRWFKTDLAGTYPRMELLGYDSALCLLTGILEYGKAFGEQLVDAKMIQSNIHFKRENSMGGYVNKCMWFIHYKPDHTIERFSEE